MFSRVKVMEIHRCFTLGLARCSPARLKQTRNPTDGPIHPTLLGKCLGIKGCVIVIPSHISWGAEFDPSL